MTSIAPIVLSPPVPPDPTVAAVPALADVARPTPETLTQRPVRKADRIDRFLPGPQRPNDALAGTRRRVGGANAERPGARPGNVRLTAGEARARESLSTQAGHSSAFVTQFIAQEVIPDDERGRPGFHDGGVAAYEATTSRARVYFGPNQPIEVRA